MEREPRAAADRIETLLDGVLELGPDEQEPAVEVLCESHPELAGAIRDRFGLFCRLLGVETERGAPESFGDYELIRPLGSGGMGVVWLARQRRGGADREVALKLVRHGALLSPDARERFHREARAAFRIEHPALCPVYDVGEVDGTPYIAMRFVPGRTLAELLDEARRAGRPLDPPRPASDSSTGGSTSRRAGEGRRPLDAVLALIETVARALHAAHEAGLVHRDVKPGNVMVTPSGDPVLLDFGLVRDEDADSSLTVSGQPVGTPAYMAPEQISPRGRVIDRTTDVYGLGATLYECVTLAQPFRADTREALYRTILTEDPPPARRSVRSLPASLDAILETALRKDQGRRFATAMEFADDLRALRLLQPIRARAAGPFERARLWVRRNPVVSVVLVLLAGALGLAVWQAREANERAEEARLARAHAEASFAEARDSIAELTSTARDRLRDVPGFEGVRRALLERVIAFHERFATQRTDDRELLADVVQAWEAVADLRMELGEFEAASDAIVRAAAAAERRFATEGSRAARDDVARIAHLEGVVLSQQGDLDGSIRALTRALDVYEALLSERSSGAQMAIGRVFVGEHLGEALHRAGRGEDALVAASSARDAIDVAEALGASRLDVLKARAGIASLIARVHRDLERFELAETAFAEWIGVLRTILDANPEDRSERHEFASALVARARMLSRQARYDEALRDLDESVVLLEALIDAFPEARSYSGSLAIAWNNRYSVLRRLRRRADAEESLQRAREMAEQNVLLMPSDVEARGALASVSFNLGNSVRRSEGPGAAIPYYEAALDERAELAESYPDDLQHVRGAATAAESLALCYFLTDQPERADPLMERTREWLELLVERGPDDPRNRAQLARLRFNQGARRLELADAQGAEAAFADALAMREQLAARNPSNLRLRRDELLTRSRLARARLEIDVTLAAALAQESLDRHEDLPEAVRRDLDDEGVVRGSLASLWNVAGIAAARSGDSSAARAAHERARELLASVVEDPTVLGWARADALIAEVAGAEIAHADGDHAGALEHVRGAMVILGPLADRPLLGDDVRRAARESCDRLMPLLDLLESDDPSRIVFARVRSSLAE